MSPLLRHGARTLVLWSALGFLALIIAGYALFEFRGVLMGPEIVVATPANGATVGPAFDLTGDTSRVASLFINGRIANVNEQGHFAERLVAPQGSFILTLRATDRFGRETITRLSLYGYAQKGSESEGGEISTSTSEQGGE